MAKIKVSELSGAALDWAVAKCEGFKADQIKANGPVHLFKTVGYAPIPYQPSIDWNLAGPIIDRECIGLQPNLGEIGNFRAVIYYVPSPGVEKFFAEGPTMLIAAMRCYVASKLGETVEVPDELI